MRRILRKPRHWPGGGRIAAAAALGLAMSAGQAPFGLWPATALALAGLVLLIGAEAGRDNPAQGQACRAFWRAQAWLAWAAGTGYFAGSLNWIYEPFLVDAEDYGWMAPFAVALMAMGLALFWAAAAGLAGRLRSGALGLVAALSLAELARSYVLTGFPWALIGHVWAETPVAQTAALIGPVGLTLGTALAALGLSRLWPAAGRGLAARLLPAALSLALIGGAWGWGQWRLSLPEPAAPGTVIRLVQPDAIQSLKWDPVAARTYFDRQIDFTAAPGKDGHRPDLVVWPETAMPYLLERSPEVAKIIADAGQGSPVALGLQRIEGERGYNSLAVIGTGGLVTARYDKWHLVPFGEYMPAGDLLWRLFGISAFASQMGAGYSPGPGPRVLDLGGPLGKVLPLICYEAVFPQDLRAAPERAGWIMQITNDAWFGTKTGPWQHLAQARLRAIEQGLPLARAANTGISAMIDARGRVLSSLGLGQAGWIDVALPGALPATIYARTGDLPVGVVILSLLLLAATFRRRVA